MTENDSSWFQEDYSWRKTTAHVNRAAGRRVFYSVLSTRYKSTDPLPLNLEP